jgi:hypothetical protein
LLLGLPVAGVCPECSNPVAHSFSEVPFGFLTGGDARRLHRGIRCILASLKIAVCAGGGFLVAGLIMGVSMGVLAILSGLGAGACWMVGWFLVTQVHPAAADGRMRMARRMAVTASWLQVVGFIGVPLAVFARFDIRIATFTSACIILMIMMGNAWLERMVERSGEPLLAQACGLSFGFAVSASIGVILGVFTGLSGLWLLSMLFLMIAAIPAIGALLTWWSFLHGVLGALDRRLGDSTRP